MPAYSVHISRNGRIINFEDYFLPGVLISERSLELMRSDNVEKLGICDSCDGNIAHVLIWRENDLGHHVGVKYCPILFNDALKPNWKVSELV
jgi:hypothetical protein